MHPQRAGAQHHHRRGRGGAEISTRPFQLVTGRKWEGSAFGGARGRTDVPKIVDWYMEGKINIDDLITHTMPLEDINKGFELMKKRRIDPGCRAVLILCKSGYSAYQVSAGSSFKYSKMTFPAPELLSACLLWRCAARVPARFA